MKNILNLKRKEETTVILIERKRPKWTEAAKVSIGVIVATGFVWGISHAGSLTPSASPSATSYTLNDIFTRLTTNSIATAGNHSLSTTTPPASSFHTLTEIYNAIPTIAPDFVLTGKTYLGVAGTWNSANLIPSNVKSGVTYGTSSSGTYAAGGNATVPGNAPILPAQAFVDNIGKVTDSLTTGTLNLFNQGITHIGTINGFGIIRMWAQAAAPNAPLTIDLRNNAIPTAEIDNILQDVDQANTANGFLKMEGGTNGAPTGGASNQYLVDLVDNYGWTVTTN